MIILACSLYAPNAARWLAYAECRVNATNVNDKLQCECMLTNFPLNNQQDSLPDQQKQIMQQTDWIYTIKEKQLYDTVLFYKINSVSIYQQFVYASAFLTSIFHPPCC